MRFIFFQFLITKCKNSLDFHMWSDIPCYINIFSLEYFQFVLNSVCVHAGDIYVFVMFWLSAKRNKEMTFEGFIRYVSSDDCAIFKSEHRTVYQDMSRPLCEYFISSSHNTYLISDQLIGSSHLWGYARYLYPFWIISLI